MIKILLEKVDIETSGNHLLLDVKVNDYSCKLVLDTGASRTVLDVSFLESINQEFTSQPEDEKSVGVGSNQLDSYLIDVDIFEIGELKLENYQLAAMNLEHVKMSYEKLGYNSVQGVLGGDILNNYDAIINYKNLSLDLFIGA
jgi:hypothetical protein